MRKFFDPNAAGGVTTAPAAKPATVQGTAAPDVVVQSTPSVPAASATDQILSRIDQQLAPLTERLTAIETQIQTAAATPARAGAPSTLYSGSGPAGSAPGIRQGEDSMTSRGFTSRTSTLTVTC